MPKFASQSKAGNGNDVIMGDSPAEVTKYMQRPIYKADPQATVWLVGSTTQDAYESATIEKFISGLASEIKTEFADFQLPNPIHAEVSSDRHSALVARAVDDGAVIFVRFRLKNMTGKVDAVHTYAGKFRPWLNVSAFDQSTLTSYLTRHMDHWDVEPLLWTTESSTDYFALKQGCIPVTITLGAFKNIDDICRLEARYGHIQHAIVRGIVSYLYPIFYPDKGLPPTRIIELDYARESQREEAPHDGTDDSKNLFS